MYRLSQVYSIIQYCTCTLKIIRKRMLELLLSLHALQKGSKSSIREISSALDTLLFTYVCMHFSFLFMSFRLVIIDGLPIVHLYLNYSLSMI